MTSYFVMSSDLIKLVVTGVLSKKLPQNFEAKTSFLFQNPERDGKFNNRN